MVIDTVYLARILKAFRESKIAHINISQIKESLGEKHLTEELLYHFQILVENRLVSNSLLETGSMGSLGVNCTIDNELVAIDVPLTRNFNQTR
ncbi:hypothetical protein [Vibrio hepatarius]|uniref:hypothetical protein n=1 Tax=Vibrio hepatarius TaxID=171383 RepID=UPI001C0A0A5A|nr:hypothetical protein [Vibrio hepatarius]MBU2898894.1 hypothetical protein [Vibrio hepatarius]